MTAKYEANKRWRKRHPRRRHAQKVAYRAATGSHPSRSGAAHRPWEREESKLVLEHSVPDRELAALIDRSVLAIQHHRHRLKRGTAAANNDLAR